LGEHAEEAGSGAEHGDATGGASAAKAGGSVNPPPKRYRLTDAMKVLVWRLVALSNEICRLENEKKCVVLSVFVYFFERFFVDRSVLEWVWVLGGADQFVFWWCSSLEGLTVQVSEQGLRKVLYQKVCPTLPPSSSLPLFLSTR
jgi:Ubinuclein conserved middle domain